LCQLIDQTLDLKNRHRSRQIDRENNLGISKEIVNLQGFMTEITNSKKAEDLL
jgi:hypothetical protein